MSLEKLALFALTGRSKGSQNGPHYFSAGLFLHSSDGFPLHCFGVFVHEKAQDYPGIHNLLLPYGR